MKFKTVGLLLIGLGAGIILGAAGLWMITQNGKPGTERSAQMGELAPDFELMNLSGESFKLVDQKGRAVIVNFWATWCDPCRDEMPLLEQASRRYQDKLVVIGVNVDEPTDQVREFQQEYRITFPILLDPGASTANQYRVSAYPTTYFVDKDGKIQSVQIGSMAESVLADHMVKIGVIE